MKQYKALLEKVLTTGQVRQDRTGTGTMSVFGDSRKYDLREGFPLATTKKVNWNLIVAEMLWFLSGSTNTKDLKAKFWDPWAKENGDVGPIYGAQWRNWGGFGDPAKGHDQIVQVLASIKRNPMSRRHIVSAWNVSELADMALPPCPCFFQFYVSDCHLDMQMYQRSADLMLGVPFDIAGYSLLLSMVAKECGLKPRYFHHVIGDAHIYLNHLEAARLQLHRTPFPLPELELFQRSVLRTVAGDIKLHGYESHDSISLKVSV